MCIYIIQRSIVANSVSGSIHFLCMDWRHCWELLAAGRKVYSELKNLCVWNKHNGGMGSLYRSKHELIFVFKAGTAPHINNIELGRSGRYRTNVWDYPGVNSFRNGRDDDPLVRPRAVVDDRGGRLGIDALCDEVAHRLLDTAQPHVYGYGLAGPHQGLPIAHDRAVLALGGDEDAGLRVIAVRERYAGISGAAYRRRDARTNLKRHALVGERFDLLAAASEHEGIAALQPQYALALSGEADQHLADLALRRGVVSRTFADIDALRLPRYEVEDRGIDEPVIEHDVGLLHQAQRAERQEIGIAGAGAHEIDLAHPRLAERCDTVEFGDQPRFGARRSLTCALVVWGALLGVEAAAPRLRCRARSTAS